MTKLRRNTLQLSFMLLLAFLFTGPLSSNAANTNYVVNRSPLIEVPFTSLPIGAVKADGWLLTQLQLQKDGLTGNSEIIYSELNSNSAWLGGNGADSDWERPAYYVKGLVGLAYVLNDATLKTKAQKWINWAINSQQANGSFGPTTNTDWWPRMPMLYAIRDFYDATNDSRVIPFLTKYFQYQNTKIDSQPLADWAKSRAGDNLEMIFWLYNRTGDAFLLTLADKIKNQAYDWTNIFTNNQFFAFQGDFQPKHNVNVPEAMKMPAIMYQKSQAAADRDAYHHGHEHLMRDHGQPEGMQSGNEMIGGKSSVTGLELCSIVEQMQSSETAQMILGDANIGDQLEKVAFNALPGSMSKDIKGLQYYTQANQVQSKFGNLSYGQQYDNGTLPGPHSGFPCCRFNLHMGWPYFVKTLWAATNDNGLAAMAYGPSHVTAKVASGVDVTIAEETNYPFDEQLNFTVTIGQSAAFPLKFRIPAWCSNPQVQVNGELQTNVVAGSFYSINRTWSNNDKVVLTFPMHIQLNDEVNNSVSVQRGPLVYSLKIGENWSQRTDYGNGFKEYEVLPTSSWNYALAVDKSAPEAAFVVNKAATMPANPFVQATTPVTLTVSAKKLPSWGYSFNNIIPCDPPYGAVATTQATEQITMVPFGAENIRATCLPVIGTPAMNSNNFEETFSDGNQEGWVNYNGSFMVDNGEYFATNTVGYQGSKSVQTSTLFSDFIYDVKVKVGTSGDGGVMFRTSKLSMGADEYSGYYVGISAGGQNVVLGKGNNGWTSLRTASMTIAANTWYQLRVVAQGTLIKVYVNDMNTPKITYTDASFSTGAIGVRCYNAITRWDNISVTTLVSDVKDIRTTDKIKIFPNPAKNYLEVSFNQAADKKYDICILDTKGSVVQSKTRNKDIALVRFDTARLTAGIYMINIKSGNESYQSKFIKE